MNCNGQTFSMPRPPRKIVLSGSYQTCLFSLEYHTHHVRSAESIRSEFPKLFNHAVCSSPVRCSHAQTIADNGRPVNNNLYTKCQIMLHLRTCLNYRKNVWQAPLYILVSGHENLYITDPGISILRKSGHRKD